MALARKPRGIGRRKKALTAPVCVPFVAAALFECELERLKKACAGNSLRLHEFQELRRLSFYRTEKLRCASH